MVSKVIMGFPHGHFQQGRRREDINIGYLGTTATDPVVRVQQLEHNIRFLQEQHQIMLSGLHREVEVLRRRNRDMQFRLVFSKGNVAVLQSTPISSPEDDLKTSPTEVNVTSLQVELLERDIAQLKTNLSEARTRNVYLQGVVDEQKKIIEAIEHEKGELAAVGKKMTGSEVCKKLNHVKKKDMSDQLETKTETVEDLQDKLDDSDRMVRRLKRENEEQRKEIVSLRTSVAKALAENRSRNPRSQHQSSQTTRFPPVYQHNQWHNSKNSGSRESNETAETPNGSSTTLPLLRDRYTPSSSQQNSSQGNSQQQRRGYPRHHGGPRSHRHTYQQD